jgi:hypothetical protein
VACTSQVSDIAAFQIFINDSLPTTNMSKSMYIKHNISRYMYLQNNHNNLVPSYTKVFSESISKECRTWLDLGIGSGVLVIRWGDDD